MSKKKRKIIIVSTSLLTSESFLKSFLISKSEFFEEIEYMCHMINSMIFNTFLHIFI